MRATTAAVLLLSALACACSTRTYGALKRSAKGLPDLVESMDRAAVAAAETAEAIREAKEETVPLVVELVAEATAIATDTRAALASVRSAVSEVWLLLLPGVLALAFTVLKTARRWLLRKRPPEVAGAP